MTEDRYALTDDVWELLAPRLPGQSGQRGGIAQDNRRFINAVFWALSANQPWRCLPEELGNWNSTAKRFRRWVDRGIWETVLDCVLEYPEYRWLYGGVTGNNRQKRVKEKDAGNLTSEWPWLRLLCRSAALQRKLMKLSTDEDR